MKKADRIKLYRNREARPDRISRLARMVSTARRLAKLAAFDSARADHRGPDRDRLDLWAARQSRLEAQLAFELAPIR